MLLVLALLAAAPAEPGKVPSKTAADQPAYFADRVGGAVRPLTAPLDLTDRQLLFVETPDGPLRIPYRDVRSLSYSGTAMPASTGSAARHLLTIAFSGTDGEHHNLVIQIERRRREVLKLLSERTGLICSDGN